MAYIYGNTAQGCARSRRKDILLRLALPLLFVLILAGVALYAFWQGRIWLTAIFAVFFVASVLRFEELGLTVSHYLSQSQTNARAGQVVAKALKHLPNEYHVFHDLHFDGARIDHAVIGPNGLFLIRTSSHLGNISASGESLRLNGWPFLLDLLTGCWNLTQKLTKHLELQYSGAVHPCPVLCFSRASVGIMGPVRGVLVVEAGNLVQAILTHEDSLHSDRMVLLIDKFSTLVSVRTQDPVCSTDESQASPTLPLAFPATPNLPVCDKCGHRASVQEFELFPGECPKCGRLYSFASDGSEDSPGEEPRPVRWKPSVPQLALLVLLVAAGSGYLAFSTGMIDGWRTAPPPETVRTEASSPDGTGTPDAAAQTPDNASQVAAPSPPDLPDPETTVTVTEPFVALPADSTESPAEPALEAEENATGNATLAAADDPADGTAPRNATPPAAKVEAREANGSSKPADQFDKGRLVVTASRPVTLWFKNQQTFKEFGPYEVRGKMDIMLPKGFYSVTYLENGRRRQTTMSFLSDQGQLDF